jgi:hypothetical protein
MRHTSQILTRLSFCLALSLMITVAAAWISALVVRLTDNDVVADVIVRNPSLRPTDAWEHVLHRTVGVRREASFIVTDVPDSDLSAPSPGTALPTVLMTRALARTRFIQPNVNHGGFLCIDTRGLPLPALYSEWEYGNDGVKVIAGVPIQIRPPLVNDAFQPLDVVILPTRIRLFGFLVDLAVWTFICWEGWRRIRLTKRSSQPLAGALPQFPK